MIIIGVWLINGKFHATPWGRSPNEGATEWPPSPYRLLRALVSSWKTAIPDKQKEDVERLLQRLASQTPSFHLPPASVGHTRHYMPPHNYMPPHRGNTNLIMDTFVLVSKSDPVRIIWSNLVLDHNELRLLGDLLRGLHYLGRGESWCEARIEDPIATKAEPNCVPYEEGASLLGRETELVPVLIPTRDVNLDGLTETTSELRKRNRLYPKGSQMRQYLREKVQISAVAAQRPPAKIVIEAVRYAVIDKVKPHITESLPIADTVRKAAMGKFGEANNGAKSTLLSGKDESGNVLKDDHMHASYLPTDEDGDGFIDHVTVVAKGIDASPREMDALMRVKNLWSSSLNGSVRLAFEGHGAIGEFSNIPIFKTSKRWRTATPLVLSRHMKVKKRGGASVVVDSAGEQIRKELAARYGIDAVVIEYTNPRECMRGSKSRPFEFKRFRKNDRPGGGAYGLFLEFKHPVRGPLCLGYASHFGMGLFVPDES